VLPAVPWLVLPIPAQRYKTQRGYTVAPAVLIVSLGRLGLLVSFMSGEATEQRGKAARAKFIGSRERGAGAFSIFIL